MNDLVVEMFLPFAQITGTNILFLVGGLALVVGIVVIGIVFMVYGNLFLQSYMAGADVTLPSLIGMGFRQVNPRLIVKAKIMV